MQRVIVEMKRLRGELKGIASQLEKHQTHVCIVISCLILCLCFCFFFFFFTFVSLTGSQQAVMVLNTIKSQLFDLLPQNSFMFLANASSSMLKSLSPLVSNRLSNLSGFLFPFPFYSSPSLLRSPSPNITQQFLLICCR